MKIPEGSGCAECANCLIVGDRTEYLCNDNDRAAGEDCRRFVSRDSEPPSLIYGISLHFRDLHQFRKQRDPCGNRQHRC